MINILKLRKLEKDKNTDKKAPVEEIEVNEESKIQDSKPAESEVKIQEPVTLPETSEAIPEESGQKSQKKTRKKSANRKKTDKAADEISLPEPDTKNSAELSELLGEINEIEKEIIELQEIAYNEEKNEAAETDPAEIFRANLLKELLAEENNPKNEVNEAVVPEDNTSIAEEKEPVQTEKPVETVKPIEVIKPVEIVKPVEISKPVTEKQVMENKLPDKPIEVERSIPQEVSRQYEEKPIQEISKIISAIQKDESLAKADIKKKNNDSIVQLVGFMLSNEYYGVDIMKIREIIRMVDITRVPRAPHFIEGVINLRGTVIPVINLRTKVRMPRLEYDKNTRIVIVEICGTVVGFIVDAVREVLRIQENCLEAPPSITIESADYITSVAKLEDQLVILMDTEKVLSNEEGKLLGDMSKNR